jgi:hypothetical protein
MQETTPGLEAPYVRIKAGIEPSASPAVDLQRIRPIRTVRLVKDILRHADLSHMVNSISGANANSANEVTQQAARQPNLQHKLKQAARYRKTKLY